MRLSPAILVPGLGALVVAWPSSGHAQTPPYWTPLIATHGERVDLDQASFTTSNNLRRALLRYHVSPPEQGQAVRFFTLKEVEVDCAAQRTRILRKVDTSEPSRTAPPPLSDVPANEREWHKYPPGSLGALTLEKVCAYPGRSA